MLLFHVKFYQSNDVKFFDQSNDILLSWPALLNFTDKFNLMVWSCCFGYLLPLSRKSTILQKDVVETCAAFHFCTLLKAYMSYVLSYVIYE